jgi:hypothetical protein
MTATPFHMRNELARHCPQTGPGRWACLPSLGGDTAWAVFCRLAGRERKERTGWGHCTGCG